MTPMTDAGIYQEVQRYLRTGDCDEHSRGWRGRDHPARAEAKHRILRDALVGEVRNRARDCDQARIPVGIDATGIVREKAMPMVKGLFPSVERGPVLRLLEGAVIFRDRPAMPVPRGASWHRGATRRRRAS